MSEKQDLPRTFGNYSLLKLLARGGMGEIYLARTTGITGFEKYYAVKKLLKKFTHDNDVGGRFVDEAKLGARLQHPNIVQVFDLGRVNDELFMATEFVDGFDLRRVLRFCHEKKKKIPLDIALFIVREVLSGLAYAHRQVDAEGQSINLIHRDISPQNVLVSFEGEVKIIDFGLAKSTQRSQETQANVLLGNFGYMSPEQARGQLLDVRTDVYSCGIVLFELVTGTKRFVEENPLKLLEMVARPTPIMPSDRVPQAPKAVDRIYAKATSQDKDQRYASAEAFRDDVTTALHRLNPRASRENLAQFLNHLFLGGQAPEAVDNDVLNKSAVLAAKDIHAGVLSLGGSSADDLKNRSLTHGFAEDAPQTASHPLLRSARVGDVLSHETITGEVVSGPVPTLDVGDDGPLDEMPLQALEASGELDSAFESLGLTTQIKPNAMRTNESEPPSSQDGALLSEDDDAQQGPTGVYDSPPSIDVQRQIDAQAELQRQLDAQMQAQLDVQAQLEAQLKAQAAQAQLQAQTQARQQEQARIAEQARQQELARQQEQARQAEQQRQAALQAQLEEQARQAQARQAEQVARQAALQAQLGEVQASALPRPPTQPGLKAASTSTSTVAPPRAKKPPSSPPAPAGDPPSIVISADLAGELPPDEQLTMRNSRTGFGDGGAHESLIIDFNAEAGSSDEELPVVEGAAPPIRPAARPIGKPVAPATVSARPRRASEEGPPTSMPPPTRRR